MEIKFKTRAQRMVRGARLLAAAAMLVTFTQAASAHDDDEADGIGPANTTGIPAGTTIGTLARMLVCTTSCTGTPTTAGTMASTTVPIRDAMTTGTMAHTMTGMAKIPTTSRHSLAVNPAGKMFAKGLRTE